MGEFAWLTPVVITLSQPRETTLSLTLHALTAPSTRSMGGIVQTSRIAYRYRKNNHSMNQLPYPFIIRLAHQWNTLNSVPTVQITSLIDRNYRNLLPLLGRSILVPTSPWMDAAARHDQRLQGLAQVRILFYSFSFINTHTSPRSFLLHNWCPSETSIKLEDEAKT